MTRRKLTDSEIELWRMVADTAQRMHPERGPSELPKPKPKPKKRPISRLPDFTVGQTAPVSSSSHNLRPGIGEELHNAPLRMDKKSFTKMKRGKLVPEDRIDLHGMTLDRAHPALTRFILGAHSRGLRLVLVITGKGKTKEDDGPIPVRRGVLKHNVPQWLSMPPLNAVILQVTQANIRHGGTGAYYVYLRRHR